MSAQSDILAALDESIAIRGGKKIPARKKFSSGQYRLAFHSSMGPRRYCQPQAGHNNLSTLL